jgi:spore coat protein CotH
VLHLDVPDTIDANSMWPGTVTYKGEVHDVEAQLRGASASYYPKKSYKIDFTPQDEFRDEDEGFPKRHTIVLTSTFDDNAYFRQKLCYDIWNLLDGTHRVETMFTVLYLNGEYVGLYLLSDHIDGNWWEDHGHWEDGNLYKSVDHSANFYPTYGGPKETWHSGYEKKEGPVDDYTDLDGFVAFVAKSKDADFDAGIAGYVDVEQMYDWWALVVFTEADDSGGKNAYLYADPDTGRFHHAPWDFNHSFGQTWQTEREAAATDYDFYWSNNLFLRLLASPTYGPRLEARMREQLATTYAPDAIVARIDAWLARAEPSAERDWAKWQDAYRSYGGWYWRTDWTDHDGEVAYLKAWVQDRSVYYAEWFGAP